MKIYCMSDIHGCLKEFQTALSMVEPRLQEENTQLLLLGDYIHGGPDSRGVLDRIMELQKKYGPHKVIALMGNHEDFVDTGEASIDHLVLSIRERLENNSQKDWKYLQWIRNLPKYYVAGNTIFVHAGIDEQAGEYWEFEPGDNIFLGKYPAETGAIEGLDKKVVAGHVGTCYVSGNPEFHDIFYDGASHYYIDGTVFISRKIPVLLVDTDSDTYYEVTEKGTWPVLPYSEIYSQVR